MAALPKCLLCVAGYVALAAGLSSVAPELCGVGEGRAGLKAWGAAAALGLILAGGVWLILKWRRPVSGRRRVDR